MNARMNFSAFDTESTEIFFKYIFHFFNFILFYFIRFNFSNQKACLINLNRETCRI